VCLSINSWELVHPMHRDARPCRRWRPYGSPPYSFKSLKFGQFWVSVWGQGPPMRKVLSIWLQYPADENLPQFGPTWPTMTQIKNQRLEKMPQSGSQFYAIFFFSSDWKCRSPTLGRKTKIQGRTQFNCSFNRKRNPSRFHLCLERIQRVEEKVDVVSAVFSF